MKVINVTAFSILFIFICLSCISEGVKMTCTTDFTEGDIIEIGLMASSSHNAQPWRIVKEIDGKYTIYSVRDRWLPKVDPNNRELIISMGVLIGTLEMTSKAIGFDFTFTLTASDNMDNKIGLFTLKKNGTEPDLKSINTIKSIYSEKGNYKKTNINNEFELIKNNFPSNTLFYYPNGSKEYDWLFKSSVDSNQQQAWRDDVQNELANYFCYTNEDKKRGIGITPEMIRLPAIMLPIWYLTFNKDSIMSKSFRNGASAKVKGQIENSAGFILLASDSYSVDDLIKCGINYQRLLFSLRNENIEVHPISQILEEAPWSDQLNRELNINKPVQMILRVGRYKNRNISYESDVITSASIRAPLETVLE